MIGNVVVATDFTPHARDAMARAVWLPLAPGATIALIFVMPDLPAERVRLMRGTAEALLTKAAAELAAERERAGHAAVDIFTAIEVGAPAELVAQRARDERAELVLVGRGLPHGLGERLLGATAERIVRACDCSVLVVASSPAAAYRHPLVAVDLSPLSRRALELTREIATRPPSIDVVLAYWQASAFATGQLAVPGHELHAWEEQDAARARHQLARFIDENSDLGVELRPSVRCGDLARAIAEEAKKQAADLLVVGTRGHSTAAHLLLGSVAERLLRRAPCDVLAVR